jgi:hypothetical protein
VAENDEQKMEELRMRMSHGLDLMQVREDSGIDNFFSASAIFSGLCPNKDVVRHYLNVLSTLLYQQLRTIIENSGASVVKFIGRFKVSGPNSGRKTAMPPFLIGLSVDTDSFKVSCKTTLGSERLGRFHGRCNTRHQGHTGGGGYC